MPHGGEPSSPRTAASQPVMGGGRYFTAKDFPDLPEVARCVEAVGTPAEDSVVVISDIKIDE